MPAPRLSIWSGPPELPRERVEHAVGRDDQEREIDEDGGRDRQGDDDRCLAPAAPSPRGDGEHRHEHGWIELDRDSRAGHERGRAQAAAGHERHGGGDERGGQEVEPREDHPAEQQRRRRDDGERDGVVAAARAAAAERPVEREHRRGADRGELGDEDDAIGVERAGHQCWQDERRERARRILEREVAVGNEAVGDSLAVRAVERDVRDRIAEELPGDGRRDGDADEHARGQQRLGGRSTAFHYGPVATRVRGAQSARSTNGSTHGR